MKFLDVHGELDVAVGALVDSNVEFDFVTDDRCTTANESSTNWIWHRLPWI